LLLIHDCYVQLCIAVYFCHFVEYLLVTHCQEAVLQLQHYYFRCQMQWDFIIAAWNIEFSSSAY